MSINMSKPKRIYLSPPNMSGGELKYVNEAFETNWIAPLGPNVDAFESSLSEYCNVEHTAVLSSGTAALHLALIILGVKPGDDVIASTFTFSATINPIVYQGATPVLIDSETKTWNMDPVLLEKAIKDRLKKGRKPKAIIPVHLYGMPCNMKDILEIANFYEIPVIEDAAEALGSRYKNKAAGSHGKAAVLSFNGNKIITTSGGGALISNESAFVEKAKFLATQARDQAPHYQHSEIGYNYRMSNVLAGIGRGQLESLNNKVKGKRAINHWYRELLKAYSGISFQSEPSDDYFSNFWLSSIIVDPEKSGTNRENIRLAMENMNIESRPLWKPMHMQPVFEKAPAYINGTSEKLFMNGLCLPSGSNLTEDELDRISKVLKKELHY